MMKIHVTKDIIHKFNIVEIISVLGTYSEQANEVELRVYRYHGKK